MHPKSNVPRALALDRVRHPLIIMRQERRLGSSTREREARVATRRSLSIETRQHFVLYGGPLALED